MTTLAMYRPSAIALAFGLFACAAENPADVPVQVGPDAAPVVEAESAEIEVNYAPPVTPWDSVPITGTGPASGTLLYRVGGRGDEIANLGSGGEFCIDVPLAPGQNTISLQAVAADGTYGEPTTVTVLREGTPPEPEPVNPTIQLTDRTQGARYYGSVDTDTGWYDLAVELLAGTFAELVDGNTSKLVRFQGNWTYGFTDGEAIAFELKEQMAVHGFRLTVPDRGGETCGPEAFDIWLSNKAEPELDFDGISFVKVAQMTKAQTSQSATTYQLSSTVPGLAARYMAIRITDASCGNPFFLSNPTGLAELRVIAEADGTPLPDPVGAPSCATGGF